ncbi:hypothetical protein EHS13_29960 [Paenibacillus psychroresistens]|uniref:IS66 family insertion sequence element accessory protein TnpB n=1 Tax=Paenibacillus psychroresistens TaxID=1778678 RepID=A0A6B8RQZ6_9BACL|nr:hypothetical protein [Paenibacillus psychroresistens]QGQ93877.1 hypothetical protein EHS13_02620 [Paenibacillus psychroresistens]QGQ93881.1 hypothetical protein EHS13_02640 [Paenibacillus psychroresistens]QGQ96177.1 hypothetical protein EHS13_15475 [Paenibacillus psychroresistens]QGQ97913.1 hypothetical protein EHS13_25000 [Paenibacillus psychroresistens]QGQ97928.1 hypothetical protein EHS13_25085 [Paenibacillus psychroresistens]
MDSNQRTQDWITRIADFKSSGLTMSAWCKTHTQSMHQLKYWLKKMNISVRPSSSSSSTQWLPVTLASNKQKVDITGNLVVRVGSASIEVPADFNANLLRDLVRTLTSC